MEIMTVQSICPHCEKEIEYAAEDAGQTMNCCHCSQPITLAYFAAATTPLPPRIKPDQSRPKPGKQPSALRETVYRGLGWWSLFTAFGYVILLPSILMLIGGIMFAFKDDPRANDLRGSMFFVNVFAAVGMLIGGVFITIGRNMGRETICKICGNSVSSRSKICQTCRSRLE